MQNDFAVVSEGKVESIQVTSRSDGSDGRGKEAQDPQSRPLCHADSHDFWPGQEKCKELVQELAWERAKEGL